MPSTTRPRAAARLLGHLELDREPPSLDYLNRIVRAHQLRVPFESFTKLVDYEPGARRGDFLPPLEEYVDRIVTRGAGGLCWTLARGLRVLLADLGFDATLLYMDPGHCCVRVDLPEGPFYADVGYAAPLFQAYPLFESFTLATPREAFEYVTGEGGITVTRRPGPQKRLDPVPRTLGGLQAFIAAANDWEVPQSNLKRFVYAAYVGGEWTSLADGTLRRWRAEGLETSAVPPGDAPRVLEQVFGADPGLYAEALAVRRRHDPDFAVDSPSPGTDSV